MSPMADNFGAIKNSLKKALVCCNNIRREALNVDRAIDLVRSNVPKNAI